MISRRAHCFHDYIHIYIYIYIYICNISLLCCNFNNKSVQCELFPTERFTQLKVKVVGTQSLM